MTARIEHKCRARVRRAARLVVDLVRLAPPCAAVAMSLAVVAAVAGALTLGEAALASASALWSEVTS